VDYFSTNVMGTVRVLEAARHAGVRKLVYAASSSCYGLAQVPTREDAPLKPQYPYALTMRGRKLSSLGKVYKLPVNSIRIFNAYGIRSRTSGAYGAVFGVSGTEARRQAFHGVVGDGTQTRDFLYASDVARGFYLAATTDKVNQVYNVGAGSPQSVNRLLELLGGSEAISSSKASRRTRLHLGGHFQDPQRTRMGTSDQSEGGGRTDAGNIDYWRHPRLGRAVDRTGHGAVVQVLKN